jgi:pilus assembly protein Flp/PilA
MKHRLRNLIEDDSGQNLIEYTLVAAIVALGSVAALKGLSNGFANTFNSVQNQLSNAVS